MKQILSELKKTFKVTERRFIARRQFMESVLLEAAETFKKKRLENEELKLMRDRLESYEEMKIRKECLCIKKLLPIFTHPDITTKMNKIGEVYFLDFYIWTKNKHPKLSMYDFEKYVEDISYEKGLIIYIRGSFKQVKNYFRIDFIRRFQVEFEILYFNPKKLIRK